MTTVAVVTSMSSEIADQYGYLNLQSIRDWVECDEVLCYTESLGLRVAGARLLHNVDGFQKFRQFCSVYPLLQGLLPGQDGKRDYNYQFDAYKFCCKVYAMMDAIKTSTADVIVWIDADVRFKAALRKDQIVKMTDGKLGAWMLRKKKFLCSSFFVVNRHHEEFGKWLHVLDLLYNEAMILTLPVFEDAFAYQWILDTLQPDFTNLSAHLDLPGGPHNVFDDVFNGIANHYKGKLKDKIGNQDQPEKQTRTRYDELREHVAALKPQVILEIGTWNGQRAIELCKAAGARRYYGVDLFEDATNESDEEEATLKKHVPINKVAETILKAGVDCRLFKGDSKQVLPELLKHAKINGDQIDFVFIDGGHSVDTIWNDWINVSALADQGATIVFDDWYNAGMDINLYGCNHTVTSLLGSGKYDIRFGDCADPVNIGSKSNPEFVQDAIKLVFLNKKR